MQTFTGKHHAEAGLYGCSQCWSGQCTSVCLAYVTQPAVHWSHHLAGEPFVAHLSTNPDNTHCINHALMLCAKLQKVDSCALRPFDNSGNSTRDGPTIFLTSGKMSHQVLRLEANGLFARSPGAGARLGAGLRAAIKAGGCRHLWSLSVTLDDFDGSFFMNAPRKTKAKPAGGGPRATGTGRSTRKAAGPPPAAGPVPAAHPMNALALARAFHPRAPDGGVGALLNGDGGGEANSGGVRGNTRRGAARVGRGSITSLGLPYARLHPRTVEELAAHAVSSLTSLDLSYCYIGPAGAAALARALDGDDGGSSSGSGTRGRGSRSLRSLKLPHNAVGDSGAHVLGQSLSNNRCLTFLSLASNGIGPAGARALAAGVGSRGNDGGGSILRRLDIGDNPLEGEAARLLVAVASSDAATNGHGGKNGDGTSGGPTMLQVLGLDRALGAAVATREAARRAVSVAAACEAATTTTLVAVDNQVSVQPQDAVGNDGLVQVGTRVDMMVHN